MRKKLNYRKVYKWNMKHKNEEFPKMRFKRIFNIYHTIRLWFRWNFNHEEWYKVINEQEPHLIKNKEDLKC